MMTIKRIEDYDKMINEIGCKLTYLEERFDEEKFRSMRNYLVELSKKLNAT